MQFWLIITFIYYILKGVMIVRRAKEPDEKIIEELRKKSENDNEYRSSTEYMEDILNRLLGECGFNPFLTGYKYIIQGTVACYLDKSMLRRMSKVLYPYLAEKNGVTVISIEKNMRTVINAAWKGNKCKNLYNRTNCLYIEDNRKPACGELIFILESYLSMMLWNVQKQK